MHLGIRYAITLFIIIVVGLIPWVDGLLFKSNYYHFVKLVNQDGRVKIDVKNYKRGWFRSQATVNITLINTDLTDINLINPSPEHAIEPTSFVIDETIYHGPIIYNKFKNAIEFGYASMQNNLHISHEFESNLLDTPKDTGVLRVYMLASFDGQWRGHLEIPRMQIPIQVLGKIIWYGLNGDFRINIEDDLIRRLKVNMHVGSIVLEGDDSNVFLSRVTIDPIEYTYDAVRQRIGLWTGNTTISTDSIRIERANNLNIVAKDVVINSAFSTATNKFYNTNFTIIMKKLITPSQIIPEFSDFRITLSASNFSAKNLNDYMSFFKYKSAEEIRNIDLKTIEGLLVHTIIPTSVFNIDASSGTTLGDFTSHSKTTWKRDAPMPNTLNDVIQNSSTVIDVTASKTIVEKIIEIYGSLTKTTTTKTTNNNPSDASLDTEHPQLLIEDMLLGGYIHKENEGYSTTFTIQNGIWKINGILLNDDSSKTPTQTQSTPSLLH